MVLFYISNARVNVIDTFYTSKKIVPIITVIG